MERVFDDLRGIVIKEMEGIVSHGELDDPSLCAVDKLVDIWKDLDEIEKNEGGYSQTGRMPYMYENRGYSSRRYGGNYARGGGYGRDGGYSRDSATMDKLNRMMDEASSDVERDVIRKVMESM